MELWLGSLLRQPLATGGQIPGPGADAVAILIGFFLTIAVVGLGLGFWLWRREHRPLRSADDDVRALIGDGERPARGTVERDTQRSASAPSARHPAPPP